jgi:hypothetical protein
MFGPSTSKPYPGAKSPSTPTAQNLVPEDSILLSKSEINSSSSLVAMENTGASMIFTQWM